MTADPAGVAAVYDRHAQLWDDARRDVAREADWQGGWLAEVPPGGAVLDLGCGSGRPVGQRVVGAGLHYTGLDFSSEMLALARRHLPDARFVQQDMTRLSLETRFDLILSWDGFFHLTPAAQRLALPRIAAHLRPGGVLAMTVGHEAGEVTGTVGGDPVYHASLSEAEYRAILAQARCPVTAFHRRTPALDIRTVLVARRT